MGATGEYTLKAGRTVAAALSRMTTTMNRVNGVYERELGVRMVFVANEERVIFTDAALDPYENTNGTVMLTQNQAVCDTLIGTINYDIGHVFSTGGGRREAQLALRPCLQGQRRDRLLQPGQRPFRH